MTCVRCLSQRVASVSGKCRDLCYVTIGSVEDDGYVPYDLGIGGGDYIRFSWCLDCGQMQRKFPLSKSEMESEKDNGDDNSQ